jgi:hypothetical protein
VEIARRQILAPVCLNRTHNRLFRKRSTPPPSSLPPSRATARSHFLPALPFTGFANMAAAGSYREQRKQAQRGGSSLPAGIVRACAIHRIDEGGVGSVQVASANACVRFLCLCMCRWTRHPQWPFVRAGIAPVDGGQSRMRCDRGMRGSDDHMPPDDGHTGACRRAN